ncbi:MAG: glucohydrolase [Spirochaetae bacterium HGW-Spirochaetae-1]|jgi:alpha-glucosidase|nr:MAG: glucohydrolase [Spirochaetae bacterium HGW-Spirochaetae-1]
MKKKEFLWWKHGIIYQIYPRSFCDSNGDGIGDIPGIISRLDYLQELGVDGIWLSPIYESPMHDFGYDISNYRAIDPVFGTRKDFITLVKEAHRRKIHVVMDLVLNHTSHLHPWFLESRSSRNNPKRDWYIWHDGKNGRRPNNWMAAFGGHAWEWDETTGQYYLHLFLKEQPDLNWRNPDMKKAMLGDIRYWLDLGVDGFRLDVINYIVKDRLFRNNPYWLHRTNPRRHDMQRHAYDRNQPETHEILKEFRRLLNEYGKTMSVGEIYPNEGVMEPETSAAYLGSGEDELHLTFDFSPIYARFRAGDFRDLLRRWYNAIPENGWPCHVLSNHDQSRSMTRLARGSKEKALVLAALHLTQRGTPFVYYGEEIGMRDGKISRRDLVDPVGRKYWPFHPGRDRGRTPMQWNRDTSGGFTSGKPWLPVNSDSEHINVQAQQNDEGSLLNAYRRLIALRRENEALYAGTWSDINGGRDILAYYRTGKSDRFFVALNFSKKERTLTVQEPSSWETAFATHRRTGEMISPSSYTMKPLEVLILKQLPDRH